LESYEYTFTLRISPQKDRNPCNAIPGHGRRRRWPKSSELRRWGRLDAGGEWPVGPPGSVSGLGRLRTTAGRAARRRRGRPAAGARAPAKGRRGLDYVRAGCVGWELAMAPEWLGRLQREHRKMSRDCSHGESAAEPGAGRGVLAQGRAHQP
jgi:hypothetical protein